MCSRIISVQILPGVFQMYQELLEIFKDGRLIVRGVKLKSVHGTGGAELNDLTKEFEFLKAERTNDGLHANIERSGNRARPATLLVPGVNMELITNVGLAFDSDESTLRAYMFHDSQTITSMNHDDFYNCNSDKHKFEPIISRQDFIRKYRDYLQNHSEQAAELGNYNEVIGNFYPHGLKAIVGKDQSFETCLQLLIVRHQAAVNGYDLPMLIMDQAKILLWQAPKVDIVSILNEYKPVIIKKAGSCSSLPIDLMKQLADDCGYELNIEDFEDQITTENIRVKTINHFEYDDVIDYLSAITGMKKGGAFCFGQSGRLMAAINHNRIQSGHAKVKSSKDLTVSAEDLRRFILELDSEAQNTNSQYVPLSAKQTDEIIKTFVRSLNEIKDNPTAHYSQYQQTFFSPVKSNALREFILKILSLLPENSFSPNSKRDM